MRKSSLIHARSSYSNPESETSANSHSRETSSIIKEKSKSDTPCFTTNLSVTALSIDKAEQPSIGALKNAYTAIHATRLRCVALEKRKCELESQIAAIQEQARVTFTEFESTHCKQLSMEECKQSLKTAELLSTRVKAPAALTTVYKADVKKSKAHVLGASPRALTKYDQARTSSADNLQRDLAPQHITLSPASGTAVPIGSAQVLKLQHAMSQEFPMKGESHNVQSYSSSKLGEVQPQHGGGVSPVRFADRGEMAFASFPSESVGNIFGFDGANCRR
ncbi:hypothetical protein K438DRAFT_1759025 [Mycena galopus ATCC 62051]|nr:hypothetical protein K438DRAFT_1759025 [Mycena galopus ATCC 62051]